MRVRHRTPSIFSISMVDVLCCALGCVILIWLNKEDESDLRGASLSRKVAENKQLADLLARLDREKASAKKKIGDLEALLARRVKELEDLQKRLGLLVKERSDLREQVHDRTAE